MSLQSKYEHRKDMDYDREETKRSQESEFWEIVQNERDEVKRYASEFNDIEHLKRNVVYMKSHLNDVVELINKFENKRK